VEQNLRKQIGTAFRAEAASWKLTPLSNATCLGTHFREALLRHVQREAEPPENSGTGGIWDGVEMSIHHSRNRIMELPRSHELLSAGESRLLVVDMQERLLPVIAEAEAVTAHCRKLIAGAGVLDVPVSITEQYPKGLGGTVAEICDALAPDVSATEKLAFSCLNSLDWNSTGADPESRFKVVVCGIESHVCVLQTVLDLLAHGFRVYVAADAVGSRKPLDREIALDRMRSSGATIVTTESVLFEWCEVAGTKQFKEVSRLVRE
jgi:nicotinamidase-related amidase